MRTKPKSTERIWTAAIASAGALIVTASAGAQEPARPDTSAWKCEKCPFARGYESDYSVGGTYVSDDAARFGNATGYDEQGGYVYAEGTGSFTSDGYRMQWDLVDLGTDARAVSITGGQPGVYEYRLGYDELPYRRFDDTQTIFATANDERLVLPPGWVGAGTTAGMAALGASLFDRDIGADRTTYEIGADFEGLRALQFSANYRRTEREGWDIVGASFFNSAALLAAPLDDQTDTIDFTAAYTQERWFVQLGWSGSTYDNANRSWTWDNPYFTGAGPAQGQIAQYPDNEAQVISLSGAYHFGGRTTVSASASMGELEQDEALLPYTINPNVAPTALPRESFDGQVDTMHYDLRVTSQPWSFLRLRAMYRYDERDNKSSVNLWSRTIADLFPSGDQEANRPYSFERQRLGVSGTAKLDFWDWLRPFSFEAGYDRVETDRTLQEVPDQEEDIGWGRVRYRAAGGPEVSVRAGAARREVDVYDVNVAALYEQNPLMRKYNLAYRFRDFIEFRGSMGLGDLPLTLGAEALYASDDYQKSVRLLDGTTHGPLGLRKADDRRFAADLTWAFSERGSAYLQGGYEDIELRTVNSESFSDPDWSSDHRDRFRSIGAGVNFSNVMTERMGVRFNVLYAEGEGDVVVDARFAGGDGAFPDIETELKSATLDVDYRLTNALDLRLRLRYEDFSSSDWQLQGVEPATIPTVITLGADPYDYDVYLVTLAVRYSFGRAPLTSVSEEASSE